MYAVIQTGGKQYRVRPGDVVRVEKLDTDEGSTVSFDKVLLRGEGEQVEIGTPFVDAAQVTGRVRRHGRGDKIEIIKFKRRKDYQRHYGHRQDFTEVEITDLGVAADKGAGQKSSGKGGSAKSGAAGGGQKAQSRSGGKQQTGSRSAKSSGGSAAKSGGKSASGSAAKSGGKSTGGSAGKSSSKSTTKSAGKSSGKSTSKSGGKSDQSS